MTVLYIFRDQNDYYLFYFRFDEYKDNRLKRGVVM